MSGMVHGGPILSVWVVTGLAWVHGGMEHDWTGAHWHNIEYMDHD